MSGDQSMVRWRVTVTCRRPPRLPHYVGDDWSMAPERLTGSLKITMLADDYEVTFTQRRVTVTCTVQAPRTIRRNGWNDLVRMPPFNCAEAVARGMAYMLYNAHFALESPLPGELPGPLVYDVREVTEPELRRLTCP
jgi:hypothetical protein